MAIAFRASTTQTANAGSSVVLNKPTGTSDNDIVIVGILVPNVVYTVNTPAGWTRLYYQVDTNDAIYLFYKVASGEGASWTFAGSDANQRVAFAASYSGGSSGSPIDVSTSGTTGSATTSQTVASVTTTTANTMLIAFLAEVNLTSGNPTSTPPTGMTERVDYADGVNGNHITMADVPVAATGATGTKTFTLSSVPFGSGFTPYVVLALRQSAATVTSDVSTSAAITTTDTADVTTTAALSATVTQDVTSDAAVSRTLTADVTTDAAISVTGTFLDLTTDAALGVVQSTNVTSDAAVSVDHTTDVTSDASLAFTAHTDVTTDAAVGITGSVRLRAGFVTSSTRFGGGTARGGI